MEITTSHHALTSDISRAALHRLDAELSSTEHWSDTLDNAAYALADDMSASDDIAGAAMDIVCRIARQRGLDAPSEARNFRLKCAAVLKSRPAKPARQKLSKPESDITVTILPVVSMAVVTAQRVAWLWPGRIPLRSITIIEGIEGVGKSTLLCAIAASITTGRGLPDADIVEPASVLWLSAEDDLGYVLKPRLLAAGAACERVYAVGEPFSFDERGLLGLRAAIAEYSPKLVIIDPIFAYTRGDANKGNDSRALTSELKKIAEQFDCAICLVRHVGKAKGMGDPRAAGLYSIEWRAAARSVLLVGADPDQPQLRAITQTKNNLGPMAASLGYTVETDADSPSGARFYWTGASKLTAERILAPLSRDDEGEASERRDAVDFLRDLLQENEIEAADVEKARKAAGVSDYALRKAKGALGVVTRKRGYGKDQRWVWSLPDADGVAEGVENDHLQRLQVNHNNQTTYSHKKTEGVEASISQRLQSFSTSSTPSTGAREVHTV